MCTKVKTCMTPTSLSALKTYQSERLGKPAVDSNAPCAWRAYRAPA